MRLSSGAASGSRSTSTAGEAPINKATFDELFSSKAPIETEVGEALVWERLDHGQASRVFVAREGDPMDDDQVLAEIQDWGVARLLLFRDVFAPLLANID